LAVSANGLVKRFGDRRAVDGVNIAVNKGLIYGVLGPNGAGKTTTLSMLLGIIEPDEGERMLLGHAAPREPATMSAISPRSAGSIPT
jgi:ABC-2 type transport system ATP-binding protein